MLTKILFTIGVILVVILIFRTKSGRVEASPSATGGSLSVKTVTILIIVLLMAISSAVFVFQYRSDNRIVNIRVISADGTSTDYQALQKSIKGRQFTTLDERKITLGESDRIEME